MVQLVAAPVMVHVLIYLEHIGGFSSFLRMPNSLYVDLMGAILAVDHCKLVGIGIFGWKLIEYCHE